MIKNGFFTSITARRGGLPVVKAATADDSDGGIFRRLSGRAGLFRFRIGNRLEYCRRLVLTVAADEAVRRAVLFPERPPDEGARHALGETIIENTPLGQTRLYKICGIQSGGISNVYTAIDPDRRRLFCLKESRALTGEGEKKKNEHLRAEAEIACRLGGHPNLLTLHSAFFRGGRLYLVYEYIAGGNLSSRLRRTRPDALTALRYAVDICRAMIYARQTIPGFVHGDIKPANCLIDDAGRIKLADFGLAGECDVRGGGETAAEGKRGKGKGRWGGTFDYMAPELFQADETLDRRPSDVFAFGVTLFEMLTGRRPNFTGPSPENARRAALNEEDLELLEKCSLPAEIKNLAALCLAQDPLERPAEFSTIKEIIENALPGIKNENETGETIFDAERAAERAAVRLALGEPEMAFAAAAEKSPATPRPAADVFVCAEKSAALALALSALGQNSKASKISLQNYLDHPENPAAVYAHARILFECRQFREAETFLSENLSEKAGAPALVLRGRTALHLNKRSEAAYYFKKALIVDPSNAEALRRLCGIYLDEGRFSKAFRLAGKAAKMHPHEFYFHAVVGGHHLRRGDLEKALAAYKRALCAGDARLATREAFIKAALEIYRREGGEDPARFEALLDEGSRFFGGRNEARRSAKRFLSDLVRLSGKCELCCALLALDEGVIEALELCGRAERRNFAAFLTAAYDGLTEEAAAGEAARLRLTDFYYPFGKLFYFLEMYPACEKVFSDSLKSGKKGGEYEFYYLAACREINGDLEAALKFYRKAMRLNRECELNRTGVRRVSAALEKMRRRESAPARTEEEEENL